MALTTQQKQTLKAAIDADPALASLPNNSDGAFAIAAILNQTASPAYYVWRTEIQIDEVMQNGFDWTRVDNLTVGKARIWDWMMTTGTLVPSRSNVRAGVLAVFGTAGDLATRLAIFTHFQRAATRFEKIFAAGTGTAATEQGTGPSTMMLESPVSYQDVEEARNS